MPEIKGNLVVTSHKNALAHARLQPMKKAEIVPSREVFADELWGEGIAD
jgi:hypothetical protein